MQSQVNPPKTSSFFLSRKDEKAFFPQGCISKYVSEKFFTLTFRSHLQPTIIRRETKRMLNRFQAVLCFVSSYYILLLFL